MSKNIKIAVLAVIIGFVIFAGLQSSNVGEGGWFDPPEPEPEPEPKESIGVYKGFFTDDYIYLGAKYNENMTYIGMKITSVKRVGWSDGEMMRQYLQHIIEIEVNVGDTFRVDGHRYKITRITDHITMELIK